MPAIVKEAGSTLEARQWDRGDNRSIVSPTALAFLIPVLVVFFFAPFLCVFCIRKRRRDVPIRRRCATTKLPALERSEARERLQSVVEVSNITRDQKAAFVDKIEEKDVHDGGSTLEKECAICLSSLRAPSPPEPAKLSTEHGVVEEAANVPAKPENEQEEILRLKECGHEFHAECLISWAVLHKKSCPICRTVYYHEEPEKSTDIEAQTTRADAAPTPIEPVEPTTPAPPPVSNWHYFWTGRDARRDHTSPGVRSSWQHFRNFRS